MNVFVLCTGRCGSLAFARACSHMTNYTAAHESRVTCVGDGRIDFPPRHIEVDLHLAWFLGRLDARYGDEATYVHLTRDPAATAASWARRYGILGGMASGYRDHILAGASSVREISRLEAAEDYVRTVTENIALFLKDKTNVVRFSLENAEADFPRFWDAVGAEGDLEAGLAEWRVRHDSVEWPSSVKQRLWNLAQRTRRAYFPPP